MSARPQSVMDPAGGIPDAVRGCLGQFWADFGPFFGGGEGSPFGVVAAAAHQLKASGPKLGFEEATTEGTQEPEFGARA